MCLFVFRFGERKKKLRKELKKNGMACNLATSFVSCNFLIFFLVIFESLHKLLISIKILRFFLQKLQTSKNQEKGTTHSAFFQSIF